MRRSSSLLSRVAFLFLLAVAASRALQPQSQPAPPALFPELLTVSQIHRISPQVAAGHPPLRIRGVVTYLSAWPNAFFFQDATGGISVENDHPTAAFEGAEVEITGNASPGLFAPVVHATAVRVLGHAAMPRARLYTYTELMGGGNDSTWLAIHGVVRSAQVITQWTRQVLNLSVESGGGLITVQLSHYNPADAARLVDAVVRMRGVCTTSFNDKRQFTGVKLNIPSMAFIDIEEPPPPDPFALPITPVRSLLQYDPSRRYNHRLQITGTVTFQDLGRSLYLQDGPDGVLVATTQKTLVPLGTRVAAVGFPSAGAYSPILREATFRPLGASSPVPPKQIDALSLLRKGGFITAPNDAQLVSIQGQLVEISRHINDTHWLLREGDIHIIAILTKTPGTPDPSELEPGTVVAATGILSVQADEDGNPSHLRILLRNPSDLMVLHSASWWSTGHSLSVLEGALAITLLTALWGAMLRRTVREKTHLLRESEERFRRQAQHDTLTGLGSRLFLQEQLELAIAAAQTTGSRLGLLMVDLDHFKQVNDTLGHHAGDQLLCVVAARIHASVRNGDIVARMGGDEFVVLLKDLHNPAEAPAIGAKVVGNVSTPAQIDGHLMHISASVGICLYPDAGTTCDALLQNVDAAMYKAKKAGRNNFSLYWDDHSIPQQVVSEQEPHLLATTSS